MVDILVRGVNSFTNLKQTADLHGTLMDWLLTSEGLSEEEELATAVRVALGTDRLADINEVLPDPDSIDRRGWWGDLDAEEIWNGWPIGCKNWLLLRAKISDEKSVDGGTVNRVEQYTRQAIQPFVDRRIASHFTVRAARVGRQEIDAAVTIFRGPLRAIQLEFAFLWDQPPRRITTYHRVGSVYTPTTRMTGAAGLRAGVKIVHHPRTTIERGAGLLSARTKLRKMASARLGGAGSMRASIHT